MRHSPHSPRRQRKALFTAPTFERRRRMAVPLSHELRARFRKRSVPVRKGDTVRVLSGSFVGREERVAKVDRRDYSVTLDNVTLKAADEKLKPLALRPSHLVITRLNLSDPWRRRALKVREEEVTPEERGETPAEVAEEEAGVPAAPTPSEEPTEPSAPPEDDIIGEAPGEPAEALGEPTEAPPPEAVAEAPEPAPEPKAKRSRAKRSPPPEGSE